MMAQLVIEDLQLIHDLTEIALRQDRSVEDVLREFAATKIAEAVEAPEQDDEEEINPLLKAAQQFWASGVKLKKSNVADEDTWKKEYSAYLWEKHQRESQSYEDAKNQKSD